MEAVLALTHDTEGEVHLSRGREHEGGKGSVHEGQERGAVKE